MDPVHIKLSTLVIALATGVTLLVTAQHLRIPAIVPLLLGGILLGPEVSGLTDPVKLGNGIDLLVQDVSQSFCLRETFPYNEFDLSRLPESSGGC
ncbi:MAG: hypothetical protein P8O70_11255 [SAR324 cluster bacterium]|nr:hypothetical protein [SAR324 cluster bacterium]